MNDQPQAATFFSRSKRFRGFFSEYEAVWATIPFREILFLLWFELGTVQPVAKSLRHSRYFLQGISEVISLLETTDIFYLFNQTKEVMLVRVTNINRNKIPDSGHVMTAP
jgi:hypothetical protein